MSAEQDAMRTGAEDSGKKRARRLLLLGGGGHAASVLDSALAGGEFEEIGIVVNEDSPVPPDVRIVGCDDDLPRLFRQGWNCAFLTVGSVGSTRVRRRLCALLEEIGFEIPVIVDPSAAVARDVRIGKGTFVGKRAVLNAGTCVGSCAIINTGAVVEHDCRIGDFAHISPGTVLCGHVTVGDDTHVGAGSVVRQEITIGGRTLIGIGSAVVSSLPDGVTAYGNPCRVIQEQGS